MSDRFEATYLIETPHDVASVAQELAGEQSTATSSRMPGETDALIRDFGARVEHIEALPPAEAPSLPVAHTPGQRVHRARLTLSWPLHNIGDSLPMLLTTLLGNQTGMRRLSGIRLERVAMPQSFIAAQPRPAFGIAGTRRLTGVHGRPLIGSIVKPNIGLAPEQTAAMARQLAEGGVDFIKDDELLANPPYSPVARRATLVLRALDEAAQRTGRRTMYAVNITDGLDEMRRHHDAVLQAGGTCIMVNLNSVGLSALLALRRHSQLPIHGHRAGWAMMTRCPALGMEFQPYQMLHRLAGVDHLHVSGLGGKFWEHADSVLQAAHECLTPLDTQAGAADDRALPVFSGGSTIFDVAPTYRGIGTADLIFASGGGIFGHPDGLAAGCASLRQAWEAAIAGQELRAYAQSRPELAAALARGKPVRKA